MTESYNSHDLEKRVQLLVEEAIKAGADSADAVVMRSGNRSVSVRLGKTENMESAESDDVSLRVFCGRRVASVSATSGYDPRQMAERAVEMARVSPEDPHAGLADKGLLAQEFAELDLYDDTFLSTDQMVETACAMEDAARSVTGVANSLGAGVSAGQAGLALATSHGFSGSYQSTRFSRSVSVLAGSGPAMERDYDFSSAQHFSDLEDAAIIGRNAGERAVRKLGARKARTGPVNVIFDPRVARGLAGSLGTAINGASVARKTSFLRDRMGQQIASPSITLTDDPFRIRGASSRPFDGEGVSGKRMVMVENGMLGHWFLSSSVARELGLVTNGRGRRSASSVVPSSTNLAIEPGRETPESLVASQKRAFYVTEVIGQGVNMITGDYSRGASGFWIENGEIGHPVSEVTIASNLKDMFMTMTPANDLDRNFGTAAPTLLVEGMTLGGD